MPTIIPRSGWGARKPRTTPVHVALSARTATCIHWDGPRPVLVTTLAQACALMRRDQNYHMDSDALAPGGANDIGYNYLIISAPGFPAVDGLILEGRGRDILGAHCTGKNTAWIGVQIAVGGTQIASESARRSARWLHDGFVKSAGHAMSKVGHRDGLATQCPGDVLYKWIRAGMPVVNPVPVVPVVVTKPPVVTPIVMPSVERAKTRAIQTAVHITVDSVFGSKTQAAVTAVVGRRFTAGIKWLQARVGARQDGVWGPQSESARISTIKRIQSALHVSADGDWGPKTVAAYAAFLKRNYGK